MKKSIRSLWMLGTMALLLGVFSSGVRLAAQQSSPPPDQPPAHEQQPPPDQSAQPAPDSQSQDQIFSGTIVKASNKYMLQEAGGKAYNLDRQEIAKNYEGKQVRVKGVLDPDGKTIHVR